MGNISKNNPSAVCRLPSVFFDKATLWVDLSATEQESLSGGTTTGTFDQLVIADVVHTAATAQKIRIRLKPFDASPDSQ